MNEIWNQFMDDYIAGKLKGEPYEGLNTTNTRRLLRAFWFYLKEKGLTKEDT